MYWVYHRWMYELTSFTFGNKLKHAWEGIFMQLYDDWKIFYSFHPFLALNYNIAKNMHSLSVVKISCILSESSKIVILRTYVYVWVLLAVANQIDFIYFSTKPYYYLKKNALLISLRWLAGYFWYKVSYMHWGPYIQYLEDLNSVWFIHCNGKESDGIY